MLDKKTISSDEKLREVNRGKQPKIQRPPQIAMQQNLRPFRSINNLPEESGQSALEEAQSSPAHPTHIIVLTSHRVVAGVDVVFIEDEMLEEEAEVKGPHIVPYVAKMLDI